MEENREKEIINDPAAWVDEYGDYLYKCALFYVKRPEDAEEIVQDALMSAYRARDSYQGKASVKTWLRTILKNKALDYFRKTGRQKKVFAEVSDENQDIGMFGAFERWKESIPGWGKDPEAALADKRLYEVLNQCMQKLSERQRVIFTMRTIEGYPIGDICEKLSISSSNASVILYRARSQLRACVEKNWYLSS